MHTKDIEKYYLAGILVAVLIFLFFVFRPFLMTLILGTALSVVFQPIYEWIKRHITRGVSWLAALLTILIFIIVVCGPLFAIGSVVFHQSHALYQSVSQEGLDPFVARVGTSVDKFLPDGFSVHIQDRVKDMVAFVSSNIDSLFSATLSTLFSFFLLILSMFYFLKDGEYFKKSLMTISPLSDENNTTVFTKLKQAIRGVIKGYIFIALVQGFLAGVGFTFFGIPHAALWALFAGVASMIPPIGTAIIAIPAILYLLTIGSTGPALGLAIWSALIVGTVDNFLNPYVMGKNLDVPPLLVLFSVLGGIALVGPVGILVGPISVSLVFVLLSIYRAGLKQ